MLCLALLKKHDRMWHNMHDTFLSQPQHVSSHHYCLLNSTNQSTLNWRYSVWSWQTNVPCTWITQPLKPWCGRETQASHLMACPAATVLSSLHRHFSAEQQASIKRSTSLLWIQQSLTTIPTEHTFWTLVIVVSLASHSHPTCLHMLWWTKTCMSDTSFTVASPRL